MPTNRIVRCRDCQAEVPYGRGRPPHRCEACRTRHLHHYRTTYLRGFRAGRQYAAQEAEAPGG